MKYLESLFWGIIAALGALVLEFLFTETLKIIPVSFFFAIIAAGAEESLKYIVIAKRIKILFQKKSLVIASLLAGLGFAAVEAFLICEKLGTEWRENYQNIAGVILLHILTAGVIGYFVSVSDVKNWKTPVKTLGAVFLIHLAFNLLAL